MNALFPSRERCFSLRWISGIHVIRLRACVPLRRGISWSWACDALAEQIEDRTLGNQYCLLFVPQRCLYLSALHGVIFLPASGTSPVRYTSLPDLYEWSSSQLWCGEYPAIPLGKRSQVAYMYIGKGDEFAQGVWWINNLLYLCTRN